MEAGAKGESWSKILSLLNCARCVLLQARPLDHGTATPSEGVSSAINTCALIPSAQATKH